ncbi:MAG: hypothetical protein M1839_005357 [Geoglossum umbratile]|nr:MAG: hypothetical protein M1839_005357 [Geoglossum umbratile]
MNIVKVTHHDIDRVSFDSKPLVILDDSGALGDGKLLQSITAEADKEFVDIGNLPSLPDSSNFRCMLARYYLQTYSSDRYEIAYTVQVHKFNKSSSIPWEPEGQKRLVAHATLHNIMVEHSNGKRVFVKEGSMYATYFVQDMFNLVDAG